MHELKECYQVKILGIIFALIDIFEHKFIIIKYI